MKESSRRRMRIAALILTLLLVGAMAAPAQRGASLLHPSWSWGQRLSPPKVDSVTLHLKSPQDKPFLPFSDLGAPAGPPRQDGTFKGRVSEDTLSLRLVDPYTTLDKLKKKGSKRGPKGPFKKVKGALGGLTPEEVFYADEDMIIIKGGGFRGEPYDDPLRVKASRGWFFPTALSLKGAPSPSDEYNGNIPTVLPGPPIAASRSSTLSIFFPSVPDIEQPLRETTRGQPQVLRKGTNYVYLILPLVRSTSSVGEHPTDKIKLQVETSVSAQLQQPPSEPTPQILVSTGDKISSTPLNMSIEPLPVKTPTSAPVLQFPSQPAFQKIVPSGVSPSNPALNFPIKTLPAETSKIQQPPSHQTSQRIISPPLSPPAETTPPTTPTSASEQQRPAEKLISSGEVEAVSIGHSLAGDTKVNEIQPRQPINPDAEVINVGPQSQEVGLVAPTSQKLASPNPPSLRIPK